MVTALLITYMSDIIFPCKILFVVSSNCPIQTKRSIQPHSVSNQVCKTKTKINFLHIPKTHFCKGLFMIFNIFTSVLAHTVWKVLTHSKFKLVANHVTHNFLSKWGNKCTVTTTKFTENTILHFPDLGLSFFP